MGTVLFYVDREPCTVGREPQAVNGGRRTVHRARYLAVFSVEKVAHGAAAGGVDFVLGAALGVVGGAARLGLGRFFGFAAGRAAIGEAGLAGVELEFLVTNDARFDGEGHAEIC